VSLPVEFLVKEGIFSFKALCLKNHSLLQEKRTIKRMSKLRGLEFEKAITIVFLLFSSLGNINHTKLNDLKWPMRIFVTKYGTC